MKKIIPLILMTPLMFSCTGNNISSSNEISNNTSMVEEEIVDVIILAGQSNMEGNSWFSYLKDQVENNQMKEYINGYSEFQICYDCGIEKNHSNYQFTNIKLGQGVSREQFGPEVGIAQYLKENKSTSRKTYFIKYAVGGTTLFTDWSAPSSGKEGILYSNLINYVKKVINIMEDEMNLIPVIKAFCWMQGESDADREKASSYYKNLKNFVNDMRNDLSVYQDKAGIAFIDAGISSCSAWTEYETINEAKIKFSQEQNNNIYIDTISNNLTFDKEPVPNVDIYHYDSMSMIKLGHLFGEKINKFLS